MMGSTFMYTTQLGLLLIVVRWPYYFCERRVSIEMGVVSSGGAHPELDPARLGRNFHWSEIGTLHAE